MNEIMQFLETTFGPLVLIFTVSNLAAMGLQVKMPGVLVTLKDKRSLALIFVWGWVVGPVLGYLICWVLPLAEPYVVVILLCSLAPTAPFLLSSEPLCSLCPLWFKSPGQGVLG